jgi:hypothetical protein
MEKFTKEVIQASKQMFQDWFTRNDGLGNYNDYLDSLLKPKRKKIIIEVSSDVIDGTFSKLHIDVNNFRSTLKKEFRSDFNVEVKELEEVFSESDMIEFGQQCIRSKRDPYYIDEDYLNFWLSERQPK